MRLGERLVEDGRLHEAQLTAALAHQSRDGGRIGTILVESDVIDLDTLTVYLGLALGIPVATGTMLERAKPSAVRLLSPAQAARYRCIPLLIQDHQLLVATENPGDLDALDAIGELSGYRAIPRVAPEIRILYYIEKYYGVPRPARFLRLGDRPRGDRPIADNLPASPLPGLPPVAKERGPVMPPLHLRRARTPIPTGADDPESLELETDDLIVSLESDDESRAEPPSPVAVNKAGDTETMSVHEVPTDPGLGEYPPMNADDALAAIARAEDRSEVANALMSFVSSLLDLSVLFIVRDNMAFGWRVAGSPTGRSHVDHIVFPLEVPSCLQAAHSDERGYVTGPLTASPLHSHMFRILGVREPSDAIAVCISLGKRTVNILYGHRLSGTLAADESMAIRDVCEAVASAYARLIAVKKRPTTPPVTPIG